MKALAVAGTRVGWGYATLPDGYDDPTPRKRMYPRTIVDWQPLDACTLQGGALVSPARRRQREIIAEMKAALQPEFAAMAEIEVAELRREQLIEAAEAAWEHRLHELVSEGVDLPGWVTSREYRTLVEELGCLDAQWKVNVLVWAAESRVQPAPLKPLIQRLVSEGEHRRRCRLSKLDISNVWKRVYANCADWEKGSDRIGVWFVRGEPDERQRARGWGGDLEAIRFAPRVRNRLRPSRSTVP